MFLTPKNGVSNNNKIRFAMKVNGSTEQVIDGTAALPTGGWHPCGHYPERFDGNALRRWRAGREQYLPCLNHPMLGVTTQN